MGALSSRQEGSTEEEETDHVTTYRYPPKSGRFFGSHFILGGEKFDTPQPEAFLFGDNGDLNFLGCRPVACPYALPTVDQPCRTLKALINIRRDSLRLVRSRTVEPAEDVDQRYCVQFTFDSDVPCAISVHYLCTEELGKQGLSYRSCDPTLSSPVYRYPAGAAQAFTRDEHTLRPAPLVDAAAEYTGDGQLYLLVVECRALTGDQCHVTTGVLERTADAASFLLKPLKQKLYTDGMVFLLQEVYGIENKPPSDQDADESVAECVVCMSELRDTLILPCRHLCVCSSCADHLRYQANNCPICRAPFRALLQVRAVQRLAAGATAAESDDGVPDGYQAVPLVEALNGPPPEPRRTAAARRRAGSTASSNASSQPQQSRRPRPRSPPPSPAPASRSRTPSREKAQHQQLLQDDVYNSRLVTVIPVSHGCSVPSSPPVTDSEDEHHLTGRPQNPASARRAAWSSPAYTADTRTVSVSPRPQPSTTRTVSVSPRPQSAETRTVSVSPCPQPSTTRTVSVSPCPQPSTTRTVSVSPRPQSAVTRPRETQM